ncbi:MAG: CRISPR-associated protein Csx20 [Candidatus Desulfofervidaceae bacterium]|nr:CRISPR-associated protein Csx20 [Candidatus Desulfofervidaceae bacterium]
MPTIYLLFSHKLTPEQEKDLKENWQVENIISLPPELQYLWSQVPPDLFELNEYLEPIKGWLKENVQKGDLVLIQGDFGAVYLMVNYAFSLGLTPIYATTERAVKEESSPEGEVVIERIFRHKRFRRYGR